MEKKRVAIVVNSLAKGGAERGSAMISKICEYLEWHVTLISVNDFVDFDYGGDYVCLGNQKTTNIFKKKWSKFKHAYRLFKKEKFNIIIDARSRPTFYKVFIYKKILYKELPVISIVHNSNLRKSFPKLKWQTEYLYKNDRIITVSKKAEEIVKKTYSFNDVRTINYAVSKEDLIKLTTTIIENRCDNYILFFGRFENKSKNLLFLIEAYAQSILPDKDIKLMLLGKGPDESILRNKVKELHIEKNVVFEYFTPNPMPYVKKALFTVMTSHYEGFPMSIIESLSIGTPLVTLDFISGPSEIIETGKNGILVKENEKVSFAKALNKMVSDREFYNKCKSGCKESVKKFEMSQIAKEWDKLLQEI